ncbi:tetratricopeptide repeat protein [Amycolatopsis thailandensis]|uniref:tetratricopeptide repeat protein n=1 Tax=Amycolatopsis thailandensis TaxID=589330 RepID=UPI003634139C
MRPSSPFGSGCWGPDHPDKLTSRNNLASACEAAGDLDRAVSLFEATLTDSERVLGPHHPIARTIRSDLDGAQST